MLMQLKKHGDNTIKYMNLPLDKIRYKCIIITAPNQLLGSFFNFFFKVWCNALYLLHK